MGTSLMKLALGRPTNGAARDVSEEDDVTDNKANPSSTSVVSTVGAADVDPSIGGRSSIPPATGFNTGEIVDDQAGVSGWMPDDSSASPSEPSGLAADAPNLGGAR